MKIAHIVCVYPPYKGGMGNSAFEMCKRLLRLGHEIDVYTSCAGGPAGEAVEEGVRVIRMKPLVSLGNAAVLPVSGGRSDRYGELGKYDIVHLHYPFFGTAEIVWLLKKLNPEMRLVVHFHMEAEFDNAYLRIAAMPDRLIRKSLFTMADAVICSSLDYARNSFLGRFGGVWESGRIKEMPFGVDSRRFYSDKDEASRKARILFVGGLDRAHYFKGVDVLIRALSGLKEKPWHLTIVGRGELKGEYERLASGLRVSGRVDFRDDVSYEALPGIYRESDLLVLPSINRGEAFGLVLLEAMASGLAVIASRLPGVRSVFQDGAEGLYAEPGDESDLRDKLARLIGETRAIQEMGKKGRELVERKYDWEIVAKRLEEVYREVSGVVIEK